MEHLMTLVTYPLKRGHIWIENPGVVATEGE